eukprot:5547086-Pyramimonas_sp.AAC.1
MNEAAIRQMRVGKVKRCDAPNACESRRLHAKTYARMAWTRQMRAERTQGRGGGRRRADNYTLKRVRTGGLFSPNACRGDGGGGR